MLRAELESETRVMGRKTRALRPSHPHTRKISLAKSKVVLNISPPEVQARNASTPEIRNETKEAIPPEVKIEPTTTTPVAQEFHELTGTFGKTSRRVPELQDDEDQFPPGTILREPKAGKVPKSSLVNRLPRLSQKSGFVLRNAKWNFDFQSGKFVVAEEKEIDSEESDTSKRFDVRGIAV